MSASAPVAPDPKPFHSLGGPRWSRDRPAAHLDDSWQWVNTACAYALPEEGWDARVTSFDYGHEVVLVVRSHEPPTRTSFYLHGKRGHDGSLTFVDWRVYTDRVERLEKLIRYAVERVQESAEEGTL